MPASFYNNAAVMVGVDEHPVHLAPTGPAEYMWGKIKIASYLVSVPLRWPGGDEAKRTSNVTADGFPMIRDGFAVGKVPHVPRPAPMHPYQAVKNALIIKDSKTRHLMTVASVSSGGDPLAVCLVGPLGPNINCQESKAGKKSEKMTGLVISGCTVVTQPSYKDFVFRFFDDFIKKWLVETLIKLVDILLRLMRVGAVPRAVVRWIAKKVLPVLVDWAEEAAKWLWDVVARQHRKRPSASLLPGAAG